MTNPHPIPTESAITNKNIYIHEFKKQLEALDIFALGISCYEVLQKAYRQWHAIYELQNEKQSTKTNTNVKQQLANTFTLPQGGPCWHSLRSGEIPGLDTQEQKKTVKAQDTSTFSSASDSLPISENLKSLLKDMMHPDFNQRPSAKTILRRVKEI